MRKRLRKRFFVDPKVQGALVVRALAYWIACIITIALFRKIAIGIMQFVPADAAGPMPFLPEILASLFFLPLVVCDIVVMSNRFVGPMYRLRRCMRQLADGEHVEPVHFRDGDLWNEFANVFNDLSARMQKLEESPSQTEEPAGALEEDPSPVGVG